MNPRVRAAICLIWRDGRLLVQRRPEHVFLGGMREFPGGKIEPGETPAECAVREAREEAGLLVELTGRREALAYDYPDRRVTLYPFDARIVGGQPSPEARWMAPGEMRDADFPPATSPLLRRLRQEASARGCGRG